MAQKRMPPPRDSKQYSSQTAIDNYITRNVLLGGIAALWIRGMHTYHMSKATLM
ncbi:MAG: hypothetical protein P4L53_26470 [Candidatus Obscuribacterales bacterium]|nr:hypothetical protein [Candidatus Obscuribacterales bacterium]